MNSWKDLNYYTTDPIKWVHLLNLSTSDWNIGPLPPNVFAIPGPLDSSYTFPPGALIIENASQASFGSRDIEKVIFGATSGLVILWAFCWVVWNWRNGTLLRPKGSTLPAEGEEEDAEGVELNGGLRTGPSAVDGSNGLELGHGAAGSGFIPASKFEAELDVYYDDIRTELELYEKNLRTDGVEAEDVEGGTELLRRFYDAQLGIYAMQHTAEVPQAEREYMAEQGEAMLGDFRRLVVSWSGKQNVVGWSPEELEELKQFGVLLKSIPENMYR
ncbi:hypothetical protein B0T14DRAFT_143781 [Immersiella caudata]|uniref:Uncharacterized protein n=1 Tax=Immersiella caudata TaxID=314043 RepID=A0AA40C859_9PEZI|nr:hypothetical protein B0T14DRAFT_143781 [Immersiella caudata]